MIRIERINHEVLNKDEASNKEDSKKALRAALYARVSTEDQAVKGFSLDAQIEKLRAYCKAKGWVIAREFVDDGYSGRDENRPRYQLMLNDMADWDIIVVLKMDRIHRNSVNFASMMDRLNNCEKGFASVQEAFDSTTAMGRFVMDIIQRIAQLESEQISERVKFGMVQKAKEGRGYLGFNIPYGYNYENGNLNINLKEAEVVEKIFKLYLSGFSISKIVQYLNNKGHKTKKGRGWKKQTVANILKNPLYCGIKHWQDILHENSHEGIIDIKTFNQIQQIRVSRIRNSKQNKGAFRLTTG